MSVKRIVKFLNINNKELCSYETENLINLLEIIKKTDALEIESGGFVHNAKFIKSKFGILKENSIVTEILLIYCKIY